MLLAESMAWLLNTASAAELQLLSFCTSGMRIGGAILADKSGTLQLAFGVVRSVVEMSTSRALNALRKGCRHGAKLKSDNPGVQEVALQGRFGKGNCQHW